MSSPQFCFVAAQPNTPHSANHHRRADRSASNNTHPGSGERSRVLHTVSL